MKPKPLAAIVVSSCLASGIPGQHAHLIVDLNLGPAGSFDAEGRALGGRAGNDLYFMLDSHEGAGPEMWRASGIGSDVGFVHDFSNIGFGEYPAEYAGTERYVYFRAPDEEAGRELWRADPFYQTAERVADIYPGLMHGDPELLVYIDSTDTLFFRAYDQAQTGYTDLELWKYQGGAASQVKNINEQVSSFPYELTAVSGRVFFRANGGAEGREVWVSDGTADGTFVVEDIYPGENLTEETTPYGLAAAGDLCYFTMTDGVHGRELWCSNGSGFDTGTFMLRDINPGAGDSIDRAFVRTEAVGDRLFFTATDGTNPYQLYVTDGTEEGTVLVKTFGPYNPDISEMTEIGNVLFFSAVDNFKRGLWQSNGTEGGTALVRDFDSPVGGFVAVQGRLAFLVYGGEGVTRLWSSDGSASGTKRVPLDIPGSENEAHTIRHMLSWDHRLFFTADHVDVGRELWVAHFPSDNWVPTEVILAMLYGGSDPDQDLNLDGRIDAADVVVAVNAD